MIDHTISAVLSSGFFSNQIQNCEFSSIRSLNKALSNTNQHRMIHTSLPYKYLGRYVSQVPRLSIQITGVAITQLVIYALVYLYSPRIPQNNTAHLHGREYSTWSVSYILDLISNVPLSLVAGAGKYHCSAIFICHDAI
jgi:hypothetical protein